MSEKDLAYFRHVHNVRDYAGRAPGMDARVQARQQALRTGPYQIYPKHEAKIIGM